MSTVPPELHTGVLDTSWGAIFLVAGSRGVWQCQLPPFVRCSPDRPFQVVPMRLPRRAPSLLRDALAYVQAVLEGCRPRKCPPVHPAVFQGATRFRRAVWQALRTIPRGETVTYAELADRAGHPRAVRAAGGACGANPLPLFIPCHRVVAANGGLGGFSSGLAWKRHLLDLEAGGRPRTRGATGERDGTR